MFRKTPFPHLIAAAFLALGLAACQPGGNSSGDSQASPAVPSNEGSPAGASPTANSPAGTTTGDIQSLWESGLHARTYVVDEAGLNSACARCHAPLDYVPAMDAMPESCSACKFEVEPPPPTIAEVDWHNIPCKTCHLVKKDVVQPEYSWLAIPIMDEYEAVADTTELCTKCHTDVDGVDHAGIKAAGAHADYVCTQCHEAHSLAASCSNTECHADVLNASAAIPGHDADHKLVTCGACHDAAGLAVGPDDQGNWITLQPETSTPLVSHNTVKEAPCERCHFPNNPWKLSEAVSKTAP